MIDPPVQRRGGHREPRDVKIVVRVTATSRGIIDRMAEKEQRNRSDMIRILLHRGIEKS